jgi:hypothetical protein
MIHYGGTELDGDPTNWWGPNIACAYALLAKVGFHGKVIFQGDLQAPVRGVFHAFRDEDGFRRLFASEVDNRVMFDLSDPEVRERVISTAAKHTAAARGAA